MKLQHIDELLGRRVVVTADHGTVGRKIQQLAPLEQQVRDLRTAAYGDYGR